AVYIADANNDAIRILYAAPAATDLAPRRGPAAGGTTVRITGSGFVAPGTQVKFGTNAATSVTVLSPTELTAIAPAGSGSVDVVVTTAGGSATVAGKYTYLASPTIAAITPATGPGGGGTAVTITGANFVDGDTTLLIGGVRVTIVNLTAGALTAVTPAGSGRADVVVATSGGTATLAAAFSYLQPPVISAVTPNKGLPGTVVTISGQNFDPAPAANRLTLGTLQLTITSASATQLVFTVPANAASGRLSVTTPGGTAQSAADFVVQIVRSIALTPPLMSLNSGATRQLTVQATYSDGTTRDITATASFVSSNTAVAAVSASGVVTAGNTGGSATITAAAGGFTATASVTVTGGESLPPDPASVAPPIDPTKISNVHDTTAFLYTGSNPIQRGMNPNTIERVRAAVIRGRVLGRDDQPVSGVRIAIAKHPEYGHTLTRVDGWFDLAVNGGGPLTVRYEKNGFVVVDRVLEVPWDDFVNVDDVVLVPYDASGNAVTFGSPSAQVARGNAVTDEAGSRRATLIFQPGTTAVMTLANGGVQTLPAATIRATELTIGASGPHAMPATLPPQTGYTYCVELSADEAVAAGASSVAFDKPASLYLDDFLNFPAGSVVPAGYYDRTCGKWVAEPNGVVVTIVSIVDGRAYLDVDGDGMADDSDAAIGTSVDERTKLAALYGAGKVLWRVPIPHLTPWDCNWPYGPPDDADGPPGDEPPDGGQPAFCSNSADGSIIECEAQALGEALPVAGTPFTLNYNSTRVLGRADTRRIHVTVSNGKLPASVKRIEMKIQVGGQVVLRTFAPVRNQTFDYLWDEQDPYHRQWQGGTSASVTINYVYDAIYLDPPAFEKSFAKLSTPRPAAVTGDRTAREIFVGRGWSHEIRKPGIWDARGAGFGGWTLNLQAFYDSQGALMYAGDGSRRGTRPGTLTVKTLAVSDGSANVKGAPATSSTQRRVAANVVPPLQSPNSITADAAGNMYIGGDGYIWRVGRDGTSSIFAGDGTGLFNGDAIAATAAGISPVALAFGPDGALYVADEANRRVRRIKYGLISTVAGNG
ncbi:MAG: repeat protein, partial [Acidobacteria bacterium]|nr:repeat protein [Acidobacteriota bacterium]